MIDSVVPSTTIFVVMATDPIKEYAKRFHSVQARTQPPPDPYDPKKLNWRDIPRRRVALNNWEYRDQPTVVPLKPKVVEPPVVWTPKKGYVYYAGDGNGRIKIGQSSNPWSRIAEMRCANPSIEVLATEKSEDVYKLERQRHEQFKDEHLALEWFKASDNLLGHIKTLKDNSNSHEYSQA